MKKNYHKIFILIFSLITAWMVAFPAEVSAFAPRMSVLNYTTLEIEGEGDAASSIIWSDLDKSTITEIVISSGITGIGDRLFRGFSNVTSVTIPSTVTWIGSEAFLGCSSLKTIKIPNSVTEIGDYAFAQCSSFTYLTFGSGLQTIGDYAFSDCTYLRKVTLPASVNELGVNVFSGCQKLLEIAVGYGSTSFSAIDKVLFNSNGTVLVAYPKGLGENNDGLYMVPEGTLFIGKYAFSGSDLLYDVTLPEGVTTIENYAFTGCQNLKAVEIPQSVTAIGNGSFSNCPSLTIYGVKGSYAQTYASRNNIPFKEIQEPVLELSDDSIDISVVGKPTYNQQMAAAKTITITNRSTRHVKVIAEVYKGEYVLDYSRAAIWPGSSVVVLDPDEDMRFTIQPNETSCGHYDYSLHITANGKLYSEVPVSVTFTHITSRMPAIEPTCTKQGRREYYKCSVCNILYWDKDCTQYAGPTTNTVIPALGHDYVEVAGSAVEATCTEDGKEADQKCSRCDAQITGAAIAAKGHTEEEVSAVDPTCTETGSTVGKKCSVCGETLEGLEEIAALGHDYVEVAGSAVEATCTEAGKEADQKCSRCNDLVTGAVIKAKGHTEEEIPAVAPTCTEKGSTAGKKCSVCGVTTEAPKEVAALGHDYKEVAGSAIEATCTEAGKEADQKCSRCNDLIKGKEIKAKGHKEEEIPAVAPTCTKKGSTAGKKCSICGVTTEAPKEVAALGHDYKEVAGSAVEATCTEAGKEADQKCSRCNDLIKGKEIKAKGHTEEEVFAVPPTCTETGFTAGKKCSVCGLPLEAPEEVAALGHKWDNGKVKTQPTASAPGVKTYTCEVCGETRDETIAKLTPAADPVLGTITTLDAKAKALSENGDPAGSRFGILQVKGKKVKKSSITLSWKAVPKATGYVIYGAPCGTKYRKLTEVKGTSYTQAGLKKGTYYKYFVSARDRSGNILASSKTVHIATSGGKKGNTKSVKLNKKKVSLKKGKTFKLKAKLKNGKLKVSKHRKVAYESDNPKIATVSGSGKIKAKSKGTCIIYAYAQNGVFAKCKVTVK